MTTRQHSTSSSTDRPIRREVVLGVDTHGENEGGGDAVAQATRITLSLLAQRIEQLTAQIDELKRPPTGLVERQAPQLLGGGIDGYGQ
ncbi:hypothetical protein AB0E08_13175 [Streptomyces sp. NPDC048281]|uniref:hypothetical protein n=1 Tax=Streptomyces sp. NPDC048281 TaxID=3154715 RepID=UPI00342CA677